MAVKTQMTHAFYIRVICLVLKSGTTRGLTIRDIEI
jgi:hypothetical protein